MSWWDARTCCSGPRPNRGWRRRPSRKPANDLVGLRKAALALLGENDLAVGDDVELALLSRNRLGLVGRLLLQLGRETRGPFVIAVSDGAVKDLDLHTTEPTDGRCRHPERFVCKTLLGVYRI